MSVTGKEPEKKPARVPPAPATIPLIALTLLSGMLCSGSALAAGGSGARRVAVLGLEGADLPPRLPVQTTAAVRREITGFPDLILVAKDAVTLSEAALTFACIDESTACMAQIGLELGAQLLLYGRMKPYREGQAHLVLHAIDVEERREIASEEGIFELSQLEDGAARLCTQLLARRGASPQARLVLNILQAGARIYLDGRPVDQAPLAMPLLAEPGLHEVKVVHEGFEEYRETIEVRGGETVRREIDLRPLPEEYPPPPTLPAEAIAPPTPPVRSWGMRISTARLAGWGLLGGGALVAAVGGTFSVLTLQTQRQFDETPYQRQAAELKETGEGYALTARVLYGVGGTLALSGAILLLSSKGSAGPAPGERAGLSLRPLLLPAPRATALGAALQLELP